MTSGSLEGCLFEDSESQSFNFFWMGRGVRAAVCKVPIAHRNRTIRTTSIYYLRYSKITYNSVSRSPFVRVRHTTGSGQPQAPSLLSKSLWFRNLIFSSPVAQDSFRISSKAYRKSSNIMMMASTGFPDCQCVTASMMRDKGPNSLVS